MILLALVTGLAACALSSWMRTLARRGTVKGAGETWLGSGLHVLIATLGGAGVALLRFNVAELVAFTALTLACSLLVVIDLATHRLPDVIVLPMYPILFASLTASAAIRGDWGLLGRAVLTAAMVTLGYLLLALIVPSGLGLGDVKLAGLLGGFLGWLGWSQALMGSVAAFVLNGLCALVLIITRKATRRSDIAFGPWMVVGAGLSATWGFLFG